MSEAAWDLWKNFLIYEYGQRIQFIGSMGGQFLSKQKGFSALVLSTKRLEIPLEDILGEILRMIKGEDGGDIPQNKGPIPVGDNKSNVSILGHQFGMIEKTGQLYDYFLELRQQIQPEGQILLTSIKSQDITSENKLSVTKNGSSGNYDMKFQYGDIFGPYFGLFDMNITILKDQVMRTGWSFNIIRQQENGNYSVLLS